MEYHIIHFETITSTNDHAKSLGEDGYDEGYVVTADSQSNGRGRKGRTFYSPDSGNLFMSLLLRPNISIEQSQKITTLAALCVSRALDELFNINTGIKWVNDIYLSGRKISGILTEVCLSADNKLDFVVLGIGVNIFTPKEGFPEELSNIAGAVFNGSDYSKTEREEIRDKVLSKILELFVEYYNRDEIRPFMDEYRERSIIIGKDVTYNSFDKESSVHVLGIDDDAHLIVEGEDGKVYSLDSGEVSVRL